MQSMTGYGRGSYSLGDVEVVVEISGVNRKQLDIAPALPRELAALEPLVREKVAERVTRGRVNVTVSVSAAASATAAASHIDVALAKAYYAGMKKLQKQLGAGGDVTIDTVLRAPGVLRPVESALEPKRAADAVRNAIADALDEFLAMREREGRHLRVDVSKRSSLISASVRAIRRQLPASVKKYRETLLGRIRNAGVALDEADERLLKEIALFAERSDVSEELARIESHLTQMKTAMNAVGAVGRSLEFLVQELAREFNTLGAKSQDVEISKAVIACKSEIEKIREQVQNIE